MLKNKCRYQRYQTTLVRVDCTSFKCFMSLSAVHELTIHEPMPTELLCDTTNMVIKMCFLIVCMRQENENIKLHKTVTHENDLCN